MAAALLSAVLGLSRVAVAQPHTGTVSGLVKDGGGTPVRGVEVLAIRAGDRTHTDSAGRFVLSALAAGPADLSLRRLAYEPVVVSIEVPDADTIDVEITLGVLPQSLPAVVVNTRADRVRVLAEFESRRKAGVGHFITRGDIEKRHPHRLSDMARTIPGLVILPENGRPVLRFARSRTSCPPQYFLDGLRVSGFNIDDVPPGDVEGVELYSGPAGLPPEFNELYGTTACGTVAIWTRIPGNAPAKP
ncbi:MAG: TonB-dependent receptor [Deltaproteobacteria bacterium]